MKAEMTPREELTLWLAATRYYMGRRTYAVHDFCDMLVATWPHLNQRTKDLIRRDVEEEFARDALWRSNGGMPEHVTLPLGQDCDRLNWERVRQLWVG